MINGTFLCVYVWNVIVFYLLTLSLLHYECFYYLFVLHADKAKGLQINLSEALQGKNS